ncbi:hypothetical protein B0J12DRAFT_649861 [Macrophomina phaseolina]|uniref:Uncharacterized protein n=1 Tax=Macrophomina phaseolina TaxID=35725 RepID=A0ABQ8GM32_9PEZI|nr:hypothetical protein B0J12DRAFT_649861 [Macrophomina phaseolina]
MLASFSMMLGHFSCWGGWTEAAEYDGPKSSHTDLRAPMLATRNLNRPLFRLAGRPLDLAPKRPADDASSAE